MQSNGFVSLVRSSFYASPVSVMSREDFVAIPVEMPSTDSVSALVILMASLFALLSLMNAIINGQQLREQ